MAFGLKQWKNPTPKHIVLIFDTAAGICMLLVTGVNSAPFLNAEQASTFSWFLGLAAPILMRFKKLFGVETEETDVPIEDVSVMEEKK